MGSSDRVQGSPQQHVLTKNQKTILTGQGLYSMYSSLTVSFIIPFALVLGASNVVVGVINALQYVAIALAQIPGERMIERFGRKAVYAALSPLSRVLWIVILLVPFYFGGSIAILLCFFFLINFIEYFAEPGYLSMVADVVPERVRGWFFAKKNMIKLFFDTVLFFLAGFYLDLFPQGSPLGFANVMLAGIVFGLLGVIVISQLSVPNMLRVRSHGFLDYLKIGGNFRKFLYFTVSFNFAVMLASPFFTVYLLEYMGFSDTMFVTATMVSILFRIVAQKHLGPLTDLVGDRAIAWIMTFGTATVPLLFFFVTADRLWLLFVAQAVSGFVWGGSDLAVFNMLLDVTSRNDRSFDVSAYTFFTAIPMAAAPLIGGWMADNVAFIVSGIPLVFLISAFLRAVSSLFLLGIPELRAREQYSVGSVIRRIIDIRPEGGVHWITRHLRNK